MAELTSRFWLTHVGCKTPSADLAVTYPFHLPAVHALLGGLSLTSTVTFLVGDNGSGKSTILEAVAVACGFNAEGGSNNFRFSTRATHSILDQHLVITCNRPRTGFFLRAESFYNVISEIEKLDAEPAPGPPIMDS